MPRIRVLSPEQMSEYHDPKHLLRPINRLIVEEMAQGIKDGIDYPVITLGTYTDEDGEQGKLMVDGNHTFRACVLAEKSWKCEYIAYGSLADALADQLKRNSHHGLRVTRMQRDRRIKQLIVDHNWSTRQVAAACGVSNATVSRVNRDQTGGNRPAPQSRGPRALAPQAFINTIENLFITLENEAARAQAVAAIYNPDRDPGEVQRIVQHLRSVAEELAHLVRQPSVRPATAARQREAAA